MSESQAERQKIMTEKAVWTPRSEKEWEGGGGAPGRAEILLQSVEESTEEMVFPCSPHMRDT